MICWLLGHYPIYSERVEYRSVVVSRASAVIRFCVKCKRFYIHEQYLEKPIENA